MKSSGVSPDRWLMSGAVSGVARGRDGAKGLGHGADPIELDEDGVRHGLVDGAADDRGVGDLRQPILDRPDGELAGPLLANGGST
jgi:hypothetical protein